MLTILGGRAGSLWGPLAEEITRSYHQGEEVVLLVPEQYTLKAERDVLEALQVPGFFRLHVLSPSRFESRVADRLGQGEGIRIDERGKLLSVARAARRKQQELQYYGQVIGQTGFAGKVTQAITQLKGAGLLPEMVMDAGHLAQPGKLHDLALIYQEYEQLLAGRSADHEDIQQEVLARFKDSDLFSGAAFFVYGFDILTEPLIRLITACAGRAAKMLVALVMDQDQAADGDAFAPVRRSARFLAQALVEAGIPFLTRWQQAKAHPHPDLAHLERQLLALGRKPYQGQPEHIHLYAARTPFQELRHTAQRILSALRAGTAPEDIAVVLAEPQTYAPLVPGVFRDYRIPHYLADKQPILGHSLVRCLLLALDCIKLSAWPQEDVFGYLKSPFSPVREEEAWALENYALKYGIHGKRWVSPFTRGEEAQALEALRQQAMEPLVRLKERLAKARSAAQSLRAVIAFLEELEAYQKVVQLEQRLMASGMQEEAVRTRQVWDKLCGLFEQMDELLGEERIPMNRFPEWLAAGLSETQLSALPPQEHCVQVGGLGQLLLGQPRLVFVLGLNAGVLSLTEEGLVSDQEREALEKTYRLRLDLPQSDKELMRQLDLWKTLSAAREGLFLSYALSDEEGKALAPLSQLAHIRGLFPELVEEGGALGSIREASPLAPVPALDELAGLLQEGALPDSWQEAWAWLKEDQGLGGLAAALPEAVRGDSPWKRLDEKDAKRLFQADTVSVSRLEDYAGCPFMHFVAHGLRPHEREVWEVKPVEYGSFCHRAMEGFSRLATADPAWPNLDEGEVQARMEEALEPLKEGWDQTAFADSARAQHLSEQYLQICHHMAQVTATAAKLSAFAPLGFELRFGPGGSLPPVVLQVAEGGILRLQGVIDRVDQAEHEGQVYLRVIDYKTGNVSLDAAEVEAGTQLALLLYLHAAKALGQEILPAGAFYQLLDDPVVPADTAEEAEKDALKKLRLSGVLLAESEVIRLMDEANPPYTLVKLLTKEGKVMAKDYLLSQESMNQLIALAVKTAGDLAGKITSGQIHRSPLINSKGQAPCRFCRFQGICRLDSLHTEMGRRVLGKKRFEDLLNR